MGINSELQIIYQKQLGNLFESLVRENIPSSSPFLLKINEERWNSADYKVVIFGQETLGWGRAIRDKLSLNLDDQKIKQFSELLANRYEDFYYEKNNGKYKSVFHKSFKRIKKILERQEEVKGRQIELVWNNINKIGKPGKPGTTNELRALERETFFVIKEELELLKPDLVIFLTGPYRDGDILANFPNATITPQKIDRPDKMTLHKKKFADIEGLPFKAIRLYHPNFRKGCTNEYLEYTLNRLFNDNTN